MTIRRTRKKERKRRTRRKRREERNKKSLNEIKICRSILILRISLIDVVVQRIVI
jgi:hypothetical protein